MDEINKYEIFNELKLNQDFVKKIKLFHVFEDALDKINLITVTNDDETFVFGRNRLGVLGFGHWNEVKNLTLNENLSNKQIVDFKNGNFHAIARTSDGKVYCWGWNSSGMLGNGRNDYEKYKPKLNQYLSDKNIVDICCGSRHSLVLTIDGQVYAWGSNDYGQIGNGKNGWNEFVSIPYHVNEFNGEKVKAIACGWIHSMALTEKGNVFSWGWNKFGQLDFKKLSLLSITAPKLIEISVVFEKISCGECHSLLLSRDSDIYVFGSNEFGQLGDKTIKKQSETPLKLKSENKFIDIASHWNYNISMALSKEGIVFIWGQCGKVIKTPTKTQFKNFDEVFAHFKRATYKTQVIANKQDIEIKLKKLTVATNVSVKQRQSVPSVLPPEIDVTGETKLFVNSEIKHEQFNDLENENEVFIDVEYLNNEMFDNVKSQVSTAYSDEITQPNSSAPAMPLLLKNDANDGTESSVKYNVFSTKLKYSSDIEECMEYMEYSENRRYSEEFIEHKFIASGSYGVVYEAKNKRDNQFYAIKKIPISEPLTEKVIKEIEIQSKLKSDFVVKLKSFWTENNYILTDGYDQHKDISSGHVVFDPHNPLLLHIQMELCSKTLKEGMIKLNSELNQKQNEIMSPLGYCISCKLFIEILDAVNFLHKQIPQIIHRDLKPTNILMSYQKNKNKFIKLGDFGLATIHEFDGQSHTKYSGTRDYRAPEVSKTTKYDTKADVYSLGVIAEELFNVDINNESIAKSTDLEKNYLYLIKLIEKMTSRQKNNRPSCEQIFNERNSWALSLKENELNSEDVNNILKKILL